MRIDKVYIEDFKNLKKFSINLDETQMNTVLLGQNATGKSNFIEVLILIFKYLDLKTEPPKELKLQYRIEYQIREFKVIVDYLDGKYIFEILEKDKISKTNQQWLKLDKSISKAEFFKNRDLYLPKYVFTYYSGLSDRLDKIFWKHQQNFYNEIKKPNFDKEKLEDLRRLFYVKQIHSFFVLLAFFALPKIEKKTKDFLYNVLGIEDLESVLFVLKRPSWKGSGDERFFGAEGLVREFLSVLWNFALAPIHYTDTIYPDFRSKGVKQDRLYLFITGKKKLNAFSKAYFKDSETTPSNTNLFKALESTYISELLEEVKVKVKKRIDGDVMFKELSEGEQQLLTVIGLLIFTKEEESLVLLDEPDTHLNPLWKYDYLSYLKALVKSKDNNENGEESDNEDLTTQIIINTHDPLVIGSMDKSQVRMFGKKLKVEPNSSNEGELDIFEKLRHNGLNQAIEPEKSPKGMGVAGILTSDMFGLPTILDKETQKKLNRKRYLQGRLMREKLNPEEEQEYHTLKAEMEGFGFYEETEDYWFKEYISEMSKLEIFQNIEFTDEERQKLTARSEEVVKRIVKKKKRVKRMRYIKIDDLKSVFDALNGTGAFSKWEAEADKHLTAVAKLAPDKRGKYWRNNNIWSKLYDAMSELSGHKCWYTESKENSSEWQVDHFRPKGKSLDENGDIILADGYWWLSYYWKNYRLSGSLCNLLRTDRFTDEEDVFGKGNFFPLKDCKNVSKENDLRCRGEIPMLLDPAKSRDVVLISFDQNGSVFPTYNIDDDLHNNTRAILSIKCYGLEHSPLIRGRKRVWDECQSIVELTNSDLKVHIHDDELIDQTLEACFQRLADLAAKNQPFSMVVFNYIQEKLNEEDYYWLTPAIKAIA